MRPQTRSEEIANDDYVPSISGGATNFGAKPLKITRKKLTPKELNEKFPDASPGQQPVGTRVMVQVMKVPEKTKGSIIRTDESQDADQLGVAYGKIVGMGSMAFVDPHTGKEYPKDFKIGDFVRFPKWGPDRINIDRVQFAILSWWDIETRVDDLSILP